MTVNEENKNLKPSDLAVDPLNIVLFADNKLLLDPTDPRSHLYLNFNTPEIKFKIDPTDSLLNESAGLKYPSWRSDYLFDPISSNIEVVDPITKLSNEVDTRLSSIHEPISDHEKRIAKLESKLANTIKEKEQEIKKLKNAVKKLKKDRYPKWVKRAIEDSKNERIL